MRYLLILLLISAVHGAEIVYDSQSPDGKWQIVVEGRSQDNALYHVATRDMHIQKSSFESDFCLNNCANSRVFWSPDSKYFVIEEVRAGVGQGFIVGHLSSCGFSNLLFDRGELMNITKLKWHHAAVSFDGWMPKSRLAVTVIGDLDESGDDFECRFVLDLKDNFKVLSYRVIKPKKA
jgi:hypothetical protein